MPRALPTDAVPDDELAQVTGGGSGWKASGEQLSLDSNQKGENSIGGLFNKSDWAMGGRKGPTGPTGGTFK